MVINSMTIQNVYIVECSSGSWDSYHWWIGGIYNDVKDAEELKDRLNAEAARVKEEFSIKYNEDDMNEEDTIKYWEYYEKHEEMLEWNCAKVKEYPLNRLCRI